MTRRSGVLVIILACLLVAASLYCYLHMVEQAAAADAARLELQTCREMAQAIRQRRSRPAAISSSEPLANETIGLIERHAQAAGIPPASLIRISPDPHRRVDDSAYKEKPTQIFLRAVTIEQLIQLVHGIDSEVGGLSAQAIRLSAPRADDTGALWNAEVTVAYLFYDPPDADR
jgi:hypothetical protein